MLRAEELKQKVENLLEEAKTEFRKAHDSGKEKQASYNAGKCNALASINFLLDKEIKNSPLK